MTDTVARHAAEINRCNQRSPRMLSVVDLIEAGTLTPELAAYALCAIGRGASFMVGARPGGAGKTTVMGALLNFVPADVDLAPADGAAAIREAIRTPDPRRCCICHEIGAGSYYAYLWGRELREYFELPSAGHMMATNLHADTADEARAQICDDNSIAEPAFRRMALLLFLRVAGRGRGVRRRIVDVLESDGQSPHRPVFTPGAGLDVAASRLVSPGDHAAGLEIIARLLASGARTVEDARTFLLDNPLPR